MPHTKMMPWGHSRVEYMIGLGDQHVKKATEEIPAPFKEGTDKFVKLGIGSGEVAAQVNTVPPATISISKQGITVPEAIKKALSEAAELIKKLA